VFVDEESGRPVERAVFMVCKVKIQSIFALVLLIIFFCSREVSADSQPPNPVERFSVRVLRTIAHDTRNFTQGLVFHDGMLYESTGLKGHSTLQCMAAKDGIVLKKRSVPHVFAEGLALWDGYLIQLTWKGRKAFIYNRSDFSKIGSFDYATQGWGLTADSTHLIMSDGSDTIYFRNPDTFHVEKKIRVTMKGVPVHRINELEYAADMIFANVWHENYIIAIDPVTGMVKRVVDAAGLLRYLPPLGRESVLNGIAYDAFKETFYLTGKNWPLLFEVDFILENSPAAGIRQ
jgi:glutamine cyclotransferase